MAPSMPRLQPGANEVDQVTEKTQFAHEPALLLER
jgi:hypothetical protein